MSTRRRNEAFSARKKLGGGGSALLLIAGVIAVAPSAAKACDFTWESGCSGSFDCCSIPFPSCTCDRCEEDWDDGDRWNDGNFPEGPPPCAYFYPAQDSHTATIERTNGTGASGVEDILRINLVTVTIESFTVITEDIRSAGLTIEFYSKDTGDKTLSVEGTITIDAVQGHLDMTVEDGATIKGDTILLDGGATGTTLTASGGGLVETYDPA